MRFRKTYYTDYVRHALCRFFADPEKLDFGSRCDELNYFACRFAVLGLTAAERRAAEAIYIGHAEADDHMCGVCRRLEKEVAMLRELI